MGRPRELDPVVQVGREIAEAHTAGGTANGSTPCNGWSARSAAARHQSVQTAGRFSRNDAIPSFAPGLCDSDAITSTAIA